MDILFVVTELAPVVKATSLADAVFALSKSLKSLGHRVTIAMPRYPVLDRAGVLAARRLTPLSLGSTGEGVPREVIVFDGRLASGVDLVLFDAVMPKPAAGGIFSKIEPRWLEGGLFGTVTDPSGVGLYDVPPALAALRSAVLCRAVIELAKQRVASEQAFDIIHAHDWPAAMVPYLMKTQPELEVTESVLSVYDVRKQGAFGQGSAGGAEGRAVLAAFGLGDDHFTPAKLEFYGGVNLLKAGLLGADAVTTVSPAYAKEIATPEAGERLDGVVRALREPVVGIVPGVDYAVENPATSPSLTARFDADDPSNKARCKTTLLAELGLEISPDRPLFVALGPLTEELGGDALAAAGPRLLKQDLSLLCASRSRARGSEEAMKGAIERAPERAKLVVDPSDAEVQRWLAAADFVLIPSRYEPGGTLHARAQRFGAIPLATGRFGYSDSIVDLDAALETGTGFLLDPPSADAIVSGVGRALAAYRHPRFSTLRRRVMRVDVGWDRPARRYEKLYKQVVQAGLANT